MNLSLTFEPLSSLWSPQQIINEYVNWFKNNYVNINITHIDVNNYNKNPYGIYSPHNLVIRNIDNKKFLVITYWDKPDVVLSNTNGWDSDNCVEVFSSAYADENQYNITPISYCTYSLTHENIANSIRKPFDDKENNKILFRGNLYGLRYDLNQISPINIISEKLSTYEYIEEINNNKINLSLNGAAEICNRDIEILSVGSVLLRPKLKQKFHNQLIPDYHYIPFDIVSNYKEQWVIIKNKFDEIKDNMDLLREISSNGLEWYKKNGTIQSNVDIIKKLVNIDKLK
jgi:hypothetical protein